MVTLRPIQETAVGRIRDAFNNGSRAVLLHAVTGYGKTVCFAHIAKNAAERGNGVLILAHQDTLIKQCTRKLNDCDLKYGIIMANYAPNPHALVQVGSVQTMVRRILKYRYEPALVIIDEAHRSAAQGYKDIIAAIPGALILGVTGTPGRLDGKGLGRNCGCFYDTLIQTESPRELARLGYLVPPEVYASKQQLDLSSVKERAGDYDEQELFKLMDKRELTGNVIDHYKEHLAGRPSLAWCVNIKHAEHVAEQFHESGIRCVTLTGKHKGEERDRVLRQLANREVDVIAFAQLLVEGIDVPSIGGLIMLRPTRSLTQYLQVCGRGARIDPENPSKTNYIVLDHAGLVFKHGLPDEEREWSLDGVDKKKKKAAARDNLIQCDACWHLFEKDPKVIDQVCPKCGHVMKGKPKPQLKHNDGKLAKITPEMAERLRRDRNTVIREAQTLEELEEIGRGLNYHPDWAKVQYGFKERQRREQEMRDRTADLFKSSMEKRS